MVCFGLHVCISASGMQSIPHDHCASLIMTLSAHGILFSALVALWALMQALRDQDQLDFAEHNTPFR